MLQREVLDMMIDIARRTKEKVSRKARNDLQPTVLAFRGDEPIAQVVLNQQGRDTVLQAGAHAAIGFDADSIGLLSETYCMGPDPATGEPYMVNPMTGQPLTYQPGSDRGDMQILAEDHDGIAKGWVCESISVWAVNRAGDFDQANLPYKYVGKSHVSWQAWGAADTVGDPTVSAGGHMRDVLVDAMNAPGLASIAHEQHLAVDQWHRDLANAYAVKERGHAVILFRDGQPIIPDFRIVRVP